MKFSEYMILEGKLEDFVKSNNLSKEDALSDENIDKLKKILKVSPEKTKAKLEKYFENNPGIENKTKVKKKLRPYLTAYRLKQTSFQKKNRLFSRVF